MSLWTLSNSQGIDVGEAGAGCLQGNQFFGDPKMHLNCKGAGSGRSKAGGSAVKVRNDHASTTFHPCPR